MEDILNQLEEDEKYVTKALKFTRYMLVAAGILLILAIGIKCITYNKTVTINNSKTK